MKRSLLILIAFAAVIAGTAFSVQSLNGKAGYTNSPSESNCTSCHNGSAANNSAGSIYMTSTMTNFQYVPGTTYTINIIVKYVGRSHFGVDVEALNTSNASVGTMTVTNTSFTQKVSANNRVNLTHKSGGIVHTDSAVYSFSWLAPATNIGNVKFYFSGVAANNNGSSSGDNVYYSNQLVTPSTVGIEENTLNISALDVHANADNNSMQISFDAPEVASTKVMVFDMTGRLVTELNAGKTNAGKVNLNVDLPGKVNNGIYIVNVQNGSHQLSKKVALVF